LTTSRDLVSYYRERKNAFQNQSDKATDRIKTISWIRVALMATGVCLFYFSFAAVSLWVVIAIILILFFYCVHLHEELNYKRNLLQNLSTINQQEIDALGGNYDSFDDGVEFTDIHHAYALDLDIFGPGSLFQRFNRTCTEQGKDRLADMLSSPLPTADQILSRQEGIRELSERIDFVQKFQAIGRVAPERKEDQQQLLDWLQLPTAVYGKNRSKWLLVGFPLLALVTLANWASSGLWFPFFIVALAQWAVIGFHARRTRLFQDYIGNKRYYLEKFAAHFELLGKEHFKSELVKGLSHDSGEAHQAIRGLVARSRALDLRLNIFANFILNSIFLYDLQCVYRLEQWREQNRDRMKQWFNAIAETDAINSLATFAFNHPSFVLPELTENRVLHAEEMGHPLIQDGSRVCNDIAMDDHSSLWIVTGANMSGKSTFLRAVGVNVVLALVGSVVCAKRLVCPVIEIYTGMRNTDSIKDHQSYFYAELQRLHGIVKGLHEGRQFLILLDEILKGTNSTDKLAGSEALIAQLVSHQCFALVATHDVSLGAMEGRFAQIHNYHFEARIENDELYFDFVLRPGISIGKNATFLMRKMGIIPA
jgi:DNA mismatch repair ATPase MutS